MSLTLREQFGDIDVYVFDQLLRGRIAPGMRVLDAGCGNGRNLVYLLRAGYDVTAVDADPAAVAFVRELAGRLAPHLPATNFMVSPVEDMPVPAGSMGVVLSSAVLHFARNDDHFDRMLRRTWSALAPGGLFVCRLASSTGIEERVVPIGDGRFLLPDGSERYLVNESRLIELTHSLGGTLVDPIKSTVVQNMRCMATWVARAAVTTRN